MKLYVVIDFQNDFVTGPLGTPEAQAIIPKIVEKIKNIDAKDVLAFTYDSHTDDYLNTQEGKNLPVEHCLVGSTGWFIVKEVSSAADIATPKFFNKPTFGCMGLMDYIKTLEHELDEIEFCGVCTDICVISNALMAKAVLPEVKISVDASCCAGVTPELHKAALSVMKSCQIEIKGE